MYAYRSISIFQHCSLDLCYSSLLCSLPNCLQKFTIADEQGVLEQSQERALTERATACSMTRCCDLEFDVPEEQELQSRCVLCLCIYKHVADSARARKRMRPISSFVPVRKDGR